MFINLLSSLGRKLLGFRELVYFRKGKIDRPISDSVKGSSVSGTERLCLVW